MTAARKLDRKRLLATSVLAGAMLIGGAAQAQTSAPAGAPAAETGAASVDEVIVTAQKRSERLQDVPVSIQAFTGQSLQEANVQSTLELTRLVPSFTATRSTQAVGVRLNIRGVGAVSSNAAESSVASFVDGIYVSRAGTLISNFLDLEGVEVLRGPQGTLFGRNASVGAIQYRSASPGDEFGGYLTGDIGKFGKREITGAVDLPVNDRLSFRVAGIASLFDGYGTTLVGNKTIGEQNTYAGRVSMRAELTDDITWVLRVDQVKVSGDNANVLTVKEDTVTPQIATNFRNIVGNIPILDDEFGTTVNNFVDGNLDDQQWGVSSDLSWNLAGGFTVRYLAGFRHWNSNFSDDQLFLPDNSVYRTAAYGSDSTSQELQLISPQKGLLGGRADFVAGLYYFFEDYDIFEQQALNDNYCRLVVRLVQPTQVANCLAAPDRRSLNNFTQDTRSYAAYFQGTFYVTDELSATFGARYTDDKKDAVFDQVILTPTAAIIRAPEHVDLKYKKAKPSWRANVSYKPNDDMMLFASFSTGFKSGGFNSGTGAGVLNQARIFQAETVENIELGAKTQWFDRRLTLNVTGFRMDIDKLQDRSFGGLGFTITNAGDLRQQGFEAEAVVRPSRDLSVNAGLAYLDSAYRFYPAASGLPGFGGTQNLKGERNNYSPKWQGNVGVSYSPELPGGSTLEVRSDLAFVSDINVGGVTAADPSTVQNGYQLLSASIKLISPDDRLSIGIYGENLTNEGYCTAFIAQSLDSFFGLRNRATGSTVQRCILAQPRSYGVKAGYKF